MNEVNFTNTTTYGISRAILPVRGLSEYVEMWYLITFLVIGGPLNLVASTRLHEMRQQSHNARLLLLKVHLNISDLMVILIYVTSRLCWLIQFEWKGGYLLCKAVHFAKYLAFAISSNIIVCIALDRLFTVYCRNYTGKRSYRNLKILLLVAWLVSIACSLPQFWIWTLFIPWPDLYPDWRQCTTVWSIMRFHGLNGTFLHERIYNGIHLLIIFWIPFLIILVSYVMIFVWLCIHQADSTAHSKRPSVVSELSDFSHMTLLSTSCSAMESTLKRTKMKVLRQSLVLVGAYVLCWLPYNILSLWMFASPGTFQTINKDYYFLYSLVVLNSAINPFLYGAVSCQSVDCGAVLSNLQERLKLRSRQRRASSSLACIPSMPVIEEPC